jgi:hypothetical protein
MDVKRVSRTLELKIKFRREYEHRWWGVRIGRPCLCALYVAHLPVSSSSKESKHQERKWHLVKKVEGTHRERIWENPCLFFNCPDFKEVDLMTGLKITTQIKGWIKLMYVTDILDIVRRFRLKTHQIS